MAESDDGSGGSHLDPGGQEVTCSQIWLFFFLVGGGGRADNNCP